MTPGTNLNSSDKAVPASAVRLTINVTALQMDALGVGAMLVISAAIYCFGIGPLIERHSRAHWQQGELSIAYGNLSESQKILANLRDRSALATQRIKASPLKLQPVTQLNQRLALVADLATQGGATLDDVQPGKTSAGTRFDVLPIHVAGTGSFPAFTAMLHRVHTQFPDTGISTFELSGSPQEEAASAKFSVELIWYTEPHRQATDRSAPNGSGPEQTTGESTLRPNAKGSAK